MRFCEAPEGCRFPVFSTDKITRKGYCRIHATRYRTDLDRRSIIQKAMAKNKSLTSQLRGLQDSDANKEILVEKGIIEGEGLPLWFKVKMELNEPRCAECGAYKPSLKQWPQGWKSCQAHLLPKKHFKSISTHPLNCLVLGSGFSGLCHCHDDYDHDWERASKMKIWPEVCRRFLILYPFIAEKEKKFIPEVLNKLLCDTP